MKILVTGAGGMLAQALVPELRRRGHDVIALDRAALDVADAGAVRARIGADAPTVVVQCAAYTAVDAAEGDAAGALLVNAAATSHVADACVRVGARLVYPSTDYVFAGDAKRPYRPDDPTAPINAYGRSKLAGEQAVLAVPGALVVRTSWLYGAGGPNFVDTMLRLARERDRLQVVDDQVGRPTWTGSLSAVLAELVLRGCSGVFHATDGGEPVSWYGFAREILDRAGLRTPVVPVSSDTFVRPAPRPGYSVLDCSRTEEAIGQPLAEWKASLRNFLSGTMIGDPAAGSERRMVR